MNVAPVSAFMGEETGSINLHRFLETADLPLPSDDILPYNVNVSDDKC